jgi:hypothetical protein
MKFKHLEIPTQEQPWHNMTMYFSNMQVHEKLYSSNFCMKSKILRLSVLGCGFMYLMDCNSLLEVSPASRSKQSFQNVVNRLQNYRAHSRRSAVLTEIMSGAPKHINISLFTEYTNLNNQYLFIILITGSCFIFSLPHKIFEVHFDTL